MYFFQIVGIRISCIRLHSALLFSSSVKFTLYWRLENFFSVLLQSQDKFHEVFINNKKSLVSWTRQKCQI